MSSTIADQVQEVSVGPLKLPGLLTLPDGAQGVILFAHGSGSSHLSPRNTFVAEALNARKLGTLQFDLLTDAEATDQSNVFDIPLLGERVVQALHWLTSQEAAARHLVGLFGASTGAAAALVAAARLPDQVAAVVSRGGRPDLAADSLPSVQAPTLLIVGGRDDLVTGLNQRALKSLHCEKELTIVPGATHLFEEPGTLEQVVDAAGDWFVRHLQAA